MTSTVLTTVRFFSAGPCANSKKIHGSATPFRSCLAPLHTWPRCRVWLHFAQVRSRQFFSRFAQVESIFCHVYTPILESILGAKNGA